MWLSGRKALELAREEHGCHVGGLLRPHRALSKYDFILYFCSYLNNFSSLVEKEHIINMFISPQSQEKVVFCLNSNGRVFGNFANLCSEQIPENWNFLESRKIRRKARSSCVTEVSMYRVPSPATSSACINLQIISSFTRTLNIWRQRSSNKYSSVAATWEHAPSGMSENVSSRDYFFLP